MKDVPLKGGDQHCMALTHLQGLTTALSATLMCCTVKN